MSQNTLASPTFEKLVESSVREAVTRTLGEQVWKAMEFYFDPRQAATNPDNFASILDKLFGSSSRVIQKIITEILMKKLGGSTSTVFGERKPQATRSFYEWIQIAKAKFSTFNSTVGRLS